MKYEPDVQCQGSMLRYPDINECQELLLLMPTSIDDQIFGPKGDPGVEVGLPFDLAGRTLPYFIYIYLRILPI